MLLMESEMYSNFTWIGPLTWLGHRCLPPNEVAKEEDVQGLSWWVLQVLGVCSHLDQGPKDE